MKLGDLQYLDTFDGKRLEVGAEVHFPVYGGYGAPPTDWQTRRGYQQHGVTEVGYTLGQRTITIDLLYRAAVDRQDYWDHRARIHDFLRPNRNGPLQLTLRTPDGSQRTLTVRADPGAIFPGERDNHWQLEESLAFVAFDPIWFDPDTASIDLSSATADNLVFPITFPIQFGAGGLTLSTGVIAYAGTWKEYPVITLTGPYTTAIITNQATAVSLQMTVAILAGAQRIIDLTPGNISVVDASGKNKFSELGPDSNLVDFNLRPDPEVADGQQEITVNFTGGSAGVSAASLDYNERYFAI